MLWGAQKVHSGVRGVYEPIDVFVAKVLLGFFEPPPNYQHLAVVSKRVQRAVCSRLGIVRADDCGREHSDEVTPVYQGVAVCRRLTMLVLVHAIVSYMAGLVSCAELTRHSISKESTQNPIDKHTNQTIYGSILTVVVKIICRLLRPIILILRLGSLV